MKKIAIVSSFSESCGNAYFTRILMDSIAKAGVEVECISLNLLLTQSVDSKVRKKADKHILDICEKLKSFDGVNIQFEAGLYGTLPSDIVNRTLKLAYANPNTSVTLHSPRLIGDSASEREAIKLVFKMRFRSAIKFYLGGLRSNISMKINERVIRGLAKRNINLITHTLRAKEQIDLFLDYTNVYVHPLKIVDENFKPNDSLIISIKNKYKMGKSDKIIGMFGFINEYKGHGLAIKAISQLPKNFKLMFFGRQHPQTIKNNELVNGYISSLHDKIIYEGLQDRVFFMGEYDNEDFMNLAGSVDAVWLPYVENGQDGSGIASICLDVSKQVLCSSSFAFDELFRLIPDYNNYTRFDIGNYMELSSKTLNFIPGRLPVLDKAKENLPHYSLCSQAELYIKLSTS